MYRVLLSFALVSLGSCAYNRADVKWMTCLSFLNQARTEKQATLSRLQLSPEETNIWLTAQAAVNSEVGGNIQCSAQYVDQVIDYASSNTFLRDEMGNPVEPPVEGNVSLETYWSIEQSARDLVGSNLMDGDIDHGKFDIGVALWGLRANILQTYWTPIIQRNVAKALLDKHNSSYWWKAYFFDGLTTTGDLEAKARNLSASAHLRILKYYITVSIAHVLQAKGSPREYRFLILDKGAWLQKFRTILSADQIIWFRVVSHVLQNQAARAQAEEFTADDAVNDTRPLDWFGMFFETIVPPLNFFTSGRFTARILNRPKDKRMMNAAALGYFQPASVKKMADPLYSQLMPFQQNNGSGSGVAAGMMAGAAVGGAIDMGLMMI